MKHYLKSKTIWGSIIAVGGSAIALLTSPAFHSQAGECLSALGQDGLASKLAALSPAIAMLGGILSAYGRSQATIQIYTPKGLPGANRPRQNYEVPEEWR